MRRLLAERRRIKQIMVLDDRRSMEGSARSRSSLRSAMHHKVLNVVCKMSCGLAGREGEAIFRGCGSAICLNAKD